MCGGLRSGLRGPRRCARPQAWPSVRAPMRANRSLMMSLLGIAAYVAVGVWGVVNLAEGDWFVGGVMLGAALVGLPSLVVRLGPSRR
jgi:hypothetical protein